MTRDESIKLGKAQAVARALQLAARAKHFCGNRRQAAKLFARYEIAESRAFEIEASIFRPGDGTIGVEDLFKSGRPML